MNILYFAFVNSNQPGQFLPSLVEEENNIKGALEDGVVKGDYRIIEDSFASLERVAERIQQYQDELVWFHYSGHAERDTLLLNDQHIRGEGIAHLLRQCPQLKGVVLNGCSTKWQAEALQNAGIPVVVGTSAPVEDQKAKLFATSFYRMLNRGKTVGDAFEMGMGGVISVADIKYHRGIRVPRELKKDAPLWVLLNIDEEALKLKLPFGGEGLEELKKRLILLSLNDLEKALSETYELIDSESSASNTLIILMGQYNDNKRSESRNTMHPEKIAFVYSRIRGGLADTIQDLEEDDLR